MSTLKYISLLVREMGFKNFWTFINETDEGRSSGEQIDFDWRSDEKTGSTPWIVIDYNNVVMNLLGTEGGDMILLQEYLSHFFNALASCKARICVVKDGKYHSQERAVIKLGRMYSDIAKRMRSEIIPLDSDVAVSAVNCIFKRIFAEHHGVHVCNDLNSESAETMYIFHVADGEADPAIRNFVRRKLEKGQTVYLMSGDASLVLGLDPEKDIFLVGLDSLSVGSSRAGHSILQGTIHRLHTVLSKLGKCATSQRVVSTAITGDMLLYVAALLDGETADLRRSQYESPYPILCYVGSFLEERKVRNRFSSSEEAKAFNIRDKLNQLYSAVTVIRAWKSTGTDNFWKLIQYIYQHARQVAVSPESQPLYGLQSWSQSNTQLRNNASYLLWKSEKFGTGTHSTREVDNVLEVEYGGDWYRASYEKRGQMVKFSEINEVRDNCPGGFANEGVRKAICDEVKERIRRSLDETDNVPNNHSTEWRIAAQFEVDGEETETLMSPLKTLVRQIKIIYRRLLREKENRNKISSTSSCETLNRSMANLQVFSAPVPVIGTDIIRICTRTVATPLLDSNLKNFTDKDLLNKFVRKRLKLPLEGIITGYHAASTASTGLQFYTVRDGDEDEDDRNICNRADQRYSIDESNKTNTLGTLLDLQHRAHYLNQLATVGAALSTISQPEEAVSRIFESLGLSSRIDVEVTKEYISPNFSILVTKACVSIANCWHVLPCDTKCRLKLMPRHPTVDTARVLYATVYAFSKLLLKTQSEKADTSEDILLKRIATALIVCPLFSTHTIGGCPAHDMFLSSSSLGEGASRVNRPHCSMTGKIFKNQLKDYNSQFIVHGASITTKRISSLIDYTLSSVLDLLGYEDTPQCEGKWIDHCLWYNLCGVQHVMGYLELNGPESLINAARNSDRNSQALIRFIDAALIAADDVVHSLLSS